MSEKEETLGILAPCLMSGAGSFSILWWRVIKRLAWYLEDGTDGQEEHLLLVSLLIESL